MSTKETVQEPPVRRTPPPVKPSKLQRPAEVPKIANLTFETDTRLEGIVKTEDIRELLDAFGLHDASVASFPFQKMIREHGELWSFRIEALAPHEVGKTHVMAHHWIYRREMPEVRE